MIFVKLKTPLNIPKLVRPMTYAGFSALCRLTLIISNGAYAAAPPAAPSAPVAFSWRFDAGDRLEVHKYGNMMVKQGLRVDYQQFKNKLFFDIAPLPDGQYRLQGIFTTYFRPLAPADFGDMDKVFTARNMPFVRDAEYQSAFTLNPSGKFTVPEKSYMPNLRHIPTFAATSQSPGGKWRAEGEELFRVGAGPVIPLRFSVDYEYLGRKTKEVLDLRGIGQKKVVDIIEYTYPLEYSADNTDGGWPEKDAPRKLAGRSQGILYYDASQNIPVFERNIYKLAMLRADGILVEYRMVIDSYFRKSTAGDRPADAMGGLEKDWRDFQKASPPAEGQPADAAPGVQFSRNEKGIQMSLRDVLFDFDSAEIRPAGRQVLDWIAAQLKKFPNGEFQVAGHTDGKGRQEYNQRLSEDRARAVAAYLTERGVDANQLSYKGYGNRNPVADNATDEGRALNRRVEVLILNK